MKQEIQQINTDVKNIVKKVVSQIKNILPDENKLDCTRQSVKIIDVFIEKLRSEGSEYRKALYNNKSIVANNDDIMKIIFQRALDKTRIGRF